MNYRQTYGGEEEGGTTEDGGITGVDVGGLGDDVGGFRYMSAY